jgi:hypothetical protein
MHDVTGVARAAFLIYTWAAEQQRQPSDLPLRVALLTTPR